MAFATAGMLATRLQRTFTDDQVDQANRVLEDATAAIIAYCRQTIYFVEDDSVTLRGTWGYRLELPQQPVVEVASVTVDGVLLDDTEWTLVGNEIRRGTSDDWPSTRLHWGGPDTEVAVVYSHGHTDDPPIATSICLAMAARCVANPIGAQAETLGAYSVTYGAFFTGSPTLLAEEKRQLRDAGLARRPGGMAGTTP